MSRPKRPRTARREQERALRKLARARQELALHERGGARKRPIEVPSSSVIAVRARGTPCPLCGGSLTLEEERAEDATLRCAHMRCAACGVARELWFRITSPLPN